MPSIICVDFDGVIHSYKSGWQGACSIPDPPVPGAFDWLETIINHTDSGTGDKTFEVCLYSSRSKEIAAIEAMKRWFIAEGFSPDLLSQMKFPTQKPPANMTVDDRAFCFEGNYPTVEWLTSFRPWNKRAAIATHKNSSADPLSIRRYLPDERQSITQKFSIGKAIEGYLTVGLFPDGVPGEIFITVAREGDTVRGLLNTLAVAVSVGLQYGVPLKMFVDKFSHVRFLPEGWTENKDIPYAKSIVDFVFRWLGQRYVEGGDTEDENGPENV